MMRAVLLAGLAGGCPAEWTSYHGNAGLTGVSATPLPDRPELLWRANTGGAVFATPVSDGDRIFVAAQSGRLIALDFNGSIVWEKKLTRTNDAGNVMSMRFDAPLVCSEGLVFAGTARGSLLALDAETGVVRWRYETGGVIAGSPNVVSNRVIVLDQSEGALHAVDIATGSRRWKTDGVERCDGSAGTDAGRIVFGSCLSALHVYSVCGKHLIDIEIGEDAQVAGGVAVIGDRAFAGTRNGSLLCADLEQGEIVWSSQESNAETFSTPAVTSNGVVYASDNGFVYAVDRKEGTLIWSAEPGGLPTSPVIAGDKVVVSSDGVLTLLDLKTGAQVWSENVSDEITSPALVNGMILVGADDGTVSAFGKK